MKSEVFDIKRIKKASVVPLKGAAGERSEPEVPGRGTTEAAPTPPSPPPDPEVPASPKRKRYSRSFKLRILKAADDAGHGGIGALLRREGLYSSHLVCWRRQLERGELSGHSAKKRGPAPKMDESTRRKLNGLERENTRLARRLKRAEKIIEIQKKISELLGIPLKPSTRQEND